MTHLSRGTRLWIGLTAPSSCAMGGFPPTVRREPKVKGNFGLYSRKQPMKILCPGCHVGRIDRERRSRCGYRICSRITTCQVSSNSARRIRRLLQPAALPRESRQPDPGRYPLRSCSNHPDPEGKHQAQNHRATTPAASSVCSHNFNSDGPDPLLNLLLPCPKGSDDITVTPIGSTK